MQDGTVELREPIERAMGYVERWAAARTELGRGRRGRRRRRPLHRRRTSPTTPAAPSTPCLKGREATGRSVDGTVLAALAPRPVRDPGQPDRLPPPPGAVWPTSTTTASVPE